MPGPVQVTGLRELIQSLHELEPEVEEMLKVELRKIGTPVAVDATRRLVEGGVNPHSLDFRVYVRRAGTVSVEEVLKKTTGMRPEFGALQMVEGLLPARDKELEAATRGIEARLDAIISREGF